MILGTEQRVRPVVDLVEPGADRDLADPPAGPDPRDQPDHPDHGRCCTPRRYPSAPFDPWEPAPVKDSM